MIADNFHTSDKHIPGIVLYLAGALLSKTCFQPPTTSV